MEEDDISISREREEKRKGRKERKVGMEERRRCEEREKKILTDKQYVWAAKRKLIISSVRRRKRNIIIYVMWLSIIMAASAKINVGEGRGRKERKGRRELVIYLQYHHIYEAKRRMS